MGEVERSVKQGVIRVGENGPCRIQGAVPIRNAKGEELKTEGPYSLCRCGGSENKPFCDGTHAKNNFSGDEVADRGPISKRRVAFKGKGITIYDDRSICSHAGRCTDNLAAAFKLDTEPWIDPQGADAEAIAAVIRTCPSGALSYALGDSGEPVEEDREAAIVASKDGPYHVTGSVQLESADGHSYEQRPRYTLCRCGGSKNKPFCDGTHYYIGFRSG